VNWKWKAALCGAVLGMAPAVLAQAGPGWKTLFKGRDLDGWQVRGDAVWTVLPAGSLLGKRAAAGGANPFGAAWPVDRKQFQEWFYRQAWLYTTAEYGEYDLHVEYLLPHGVNSGISLCDPARAHTAIGESDAARPDLAGYPKTTPSHFGYEIQIIDDNRDRYQTGSIYNFVAARTGVQHAEQWNTLDIELRANHLCVRVNGEVVAEAPGVEGHFHRGPIGLQLHDQFSVALFRNLRIREIR
jgi:hypothetical protein